MPSKFIPGDRVRVLNLEFPGHVRTPGYVRNRFGTIERYCGAFPNPERRAYGEYDAPRRELYRVHFRQRDLWPGYTGMPGDTVEVEIYEHWLALASDQS